RLYNSSQLNVPSYDGPPVPDRWSLDYDYRAALAKGWSASVDYRAISDQDYFQDFGNNGLNLTTQSFLYRDARVNYRGRHWDFQAATQGYQIIDPSVSALSEPYRMLPRLNLDGDYVLDSGLEVGIDSEYVYFDRSLSSRGVSEDLINRGALVTGQRL